jgi:hypothetical protein
MAKASKKTKNKLYEIADRKIMNARIEINKIITNGAELEKVDNILFKLNWECPKAIIDYFIEVKPK